MKKTNKTPTPKICHIIGFVMILASLLRGFSFITFSDGGKDAKAKAANVSMIRFTQSICVTVRTISVPNNAPSITMRHAATLIVIWKTTNL